jgi:serine/threonine-protein kinase HipA
MGRSSSTTAPVNGEPHAAAARTEECCEKDEGASRGVAPNDPVTYVQADVIEVRAWGRTVGAVTLDPATEFYAFEYAPEWLRTGIELAPLHMPAQPGVFEFPDLAERTFYRLPALLADALPDNFGNALVNATLVSQGVRSEAITPLDRLAYAGTRSIGALEFAPPLGSQSEGSTMIQIADLVVAARSAMRGQFSGDDQIQSALAELISVGTSAGGARAKAVISFNPETGQIRSGQFDAPPGYEYWILKLDGVDQLGQFGPTQGFGRIEFAYSKMAHAAGIDMMPCRLLEESGRAHFMTQRFDRDAVGGKVHIQSLCAMDHLDFNAPDTHSYAQYFDVVDRLDLGRAALEQAFRRCAFNVAAANRDDHTKNLGFVCSESGLWSLAPAYDVNHSYNPEGRWTQRHQMSVNEKFEHITRDDLLEVAERFNVPGARSVLGDVDAAVGRWREFAEECDVELGHTERIERDIERFRLH